MKRLLSLALLFLPGVALAGQLESGSPIGKRIDEFTLRDYRGAERALKEFADHKAVVVAFVGCECPLAKLYGPRLAQLAKQYEAKGVAFLALNSNQQDSVTAIGDYAKATGINFPILKDPGNAAADRFGAQRTPEVFVLDATRTVRYWGRIDDQYGIGYNRPQPQSSDLVKALDELLAGKPVTTAVTKAPGCFIGRVQREAGRGELTYSKHVAPILQKNCVSCHHAGEIGPFSLTSFDEVIGWTETIREVIEEGRMPPWFADAKYGHFSNDSRLPDADKQVVLNWIKNGAPQGDPKDLPPAATFVEGWRIPKPDQIITLKPFNVPATGTQPYQHFVVDPGFKEDKWVRAAEIKPSCRAVVHHILAFVIPPGGCQNLRGGFASNWLAAMAPGTKPMDLPEGEAKFVPAGSRLMFQIHYTVNGAPQVNRTELGLVFADPKSVKKEVSTEMVADPRIDIPPHDPNYKIEADREMEEDSILLNVAPHTHVRGKAFRYEAIYPNGKREMLLDLPRYDFNWQNTYVLAEPKLLPKGTVLHCTAWYDNSTKNRTNPNPNVRVHWGDQTWEEMFIGYYDVVAVHQDLQKSPRPATKYDPPKPVTVDADLQELARHARESNEKFNAFAKAVHEKAPQVDRVCLTSVRGGIFNVERASYPGRPAVQIATAGFHSDQEKMFALVHYALLGINVAHPDLSKARGADMMLISKTMSSSVHTPVILDDVPGTVNFWSKDKDAFPKETQDLLRTLSELVGQGT